MRIILNGARLDYLSWTQVLTKNSLRRQWSTIRCSDQVPSSSMTHCLWPAAPTCLLLITQGHSRARPDGTTEVQSESTGRNRLGSTPTHTLERSLSWGRCHPTPSLTRIALSRGSQLMSSLVLKSLWSSAISKIRRRSLRASSKASKKSQASKIWSTTNGNSLNLNPGSKRGATNMTIILRQEFMGTNKNHDFLNSIWLNNQNHSNL